MVDIRNIGVAQVANRAFVALAVEAGIEATIQSLITLADDKRSLLINLKEALDVDNPALANALNMGTLDAVLDYMALDADAAVLPVDQLPLLIDEDGPASVSAARDGGVSTQVNITYTEPPAGYTAEIYLDGVFAKHSTASASAGFVNDNIQGVAAGERVIRVLYRDGEGNLTRFGPVATIS